jgi:hypothetical protein
MQEEFSPLSKIPQENNKFCKLNATDPKHVFEPLSLPNDEGKVWSLNDIIENFGKKGLLCSKTVDKRKQCLRFRIDLDALAEADPYYKELMMKQQQAQMPNMTPPPFSAEMPPAVPLPPPARESIMPPSDMPTSSNDMTPSSNDMPPSTDMPPSEKQLQASSSEDTVTQSPSSEDTSPSSKDTSPSSEDTNPSPEDKPLLTEDTSISAENLNLPEREKKPAGQMLGGYQLSKTIVKTVKRGGNDNLLSPTNTPTTCVQKCLTENSPLKSEIQENTTKDLASSTKIFLVHKQIDKDERSTWEKLTSSSGGGGNNNSKRTKKKGLKKYCLTKKRKGGNKKITTRRRKTKITLK